MQKCHFSVFRIFLNNDRALRAELYCILKHIRTPLKWALVCQNRSSRLGVMVKRLNWPVVKNSCFALYLQRWVLYKRNIFVEIVCLKVLFQLQYRLSKFENHMRSYLQKTKILLQTRGQEMSFLAIALKWFWLQPNYNIPIMHPNKLFHLDYKR